MRTAFKKIAEENTTAMQKYLGEFVEGTWGLARKSSEIIDQCLAKITVQGKGLDSTLILRNAISDLCCTLDSLERGAWRNVVNNTRMSFEDYCCAIQIHADPTAYPRFLKEELDAPQAVSFAKKHRQGYEDFGRLYGMFSNLSHHSRLVLLARQITHISAEGVQMAHLKPIDPTNLKAQAPELLFIAFLFIEIGTLAEEISIDLLDAPYFGEKTVIGYQKRLDTPEALFVMKFVDKTQQILDSSSSHHSKPAANSQI